MNMTSTNSVGGLPVSMILNKSDCASEEKLRSVIGTMKLEGFQIKDTTLQILSDYINKNKTYRQLLTEWKTRHQH